MTPLETFWYFIKEREAIRLKREAGEPYPWTTDEILQDFRFCNVRREDDKVTRWIRTNWREPYADHRNLAFAMAIARQFNYIPTLEAIGFPMTWDPTWVKAMLRDRKRKGERIYGAAYMLTGSLATGGDKIGATVDRILTPLYKNGWINTVENVDQHSGLEQVYESFMGRPGFGKFLSYQCAVDIRHTRYLKDCTDFNAFCVAGPGAERGLARIFRGAIRDKTGRMMPKNYNSKGNMIVTQGQMLEEMQSLHEQQHDHLGPDWQEIELSDIQNVLCEVDKYLRTKNEEGRPKQKFTCDEKTAMLAAD